MPDRIIQLRLSDEVESLSLNPPTPSGSQPPIISCLIPLIMIISCHHDQESHLILSRQIHGRPIPSAPAYAQRLE